VAEAFVLYTAIHEPVPLRLPSVPPPAAARPEDLERCIFDLRAAELAFREVIGPAYGPALRETCALAERGVSLSVSVSAAFMEMSRRWSPELVRPTRRLLRAACVEPVASDPQGGLLFAFDIERFMRNLARAREALGRLARRPVTAAEVSGFCLNHEIYHAFRQLGFAAAAAEGEDRATQGRHPCHLARWGEGPLIAYRLQWLSDELRYQLRSGGHDPGKLAHTIASLPGEVALVSFDFDSLAFGTGGAARAAGLLGALAEACIERECEPLNLSEAALRFAARAVEHAPPVTTVVSGLSTEDLGRDGWVERLLFGRMQQAYQISRLVEGRGVRRVGELLLQRTNLSLPRLAVDGEGRPPSYWRTRWWQTNPSYDDTAEQTLAVYDNFIRAASG